MIPELIDAIAQAFMQGLPGGPWVPQPGVTFCNQAVNYVCVSLGYKKLVGLLANQIFGALQTNGDWQDVTADAAQYAANQGGLVIAAWKNPDSQQHGHVCVVMPGVLEESDSWKGPAPKVMNIGETNFIGKKASYAFSAERIPQFFVLKSTY